MVAAALSRNTVRSSRRRSPEQGYHLTSDLVDDAVHWLQRHEAIAPQKPFFLYFAPGATHCAASCAEGMDREISSGKFDQGWDRLREETFARQKALGVIPADAELTPRPAELPAWELARRRNSGRSMRVRWRSIRPFSSTRTMRSDVCSRRCATMDIADNTLVLYIVGDNGGSAEGGLEGRDLINADGSIPSRAGRRLNAGGALRSRSASTITTPPPGHGRRQHALSMDEADRPRISAARAIR